MQNKRVNRPVPNEESAFAYEGCQCSLSESIAVSQLVNFRLLDELIKEWVNSQMILLMW